MILLSHQGVGDLILINGLVRSLANHYDRIRIPVRERNLVSIAWMYSDLENVYVEPLKHEDSMECYREVGEPVVGLGFYANDDTFDRSKFDQEFYRQAGVPFQHRWDAFYVPQPEVLDLVERETPYAFMHEDVDRGFAIDKNRLPEFTRYTPGMSDNIFSFMPLIENATEIHVIHSAFLALADSLPLKATRLVIHDYARQLGEAMPALRYPWTLEK